MMRFPTFLVAVGILLAGMAYATSADEAATTDGLAQVVPPTPIPPKPPIPPENPDDPRPPRPQPEPDPPPEVAPVV